MEWYYLMTIAALAICLIGLLSHVLKLSKLGYPKDFAQKAGEPKNGIKYAMSGAMSPKKKESAYKYLPTYVAGLLYHFGSFLMIALFVLILFRLEFGNILNVIIALFLSITGLCGFAILLKRVFKKELHSLSNADDFIANLLVTAIHFMTAWIIYFDTFHSLYFILISILLIYIPISKLKHMVYFFYARIQLGIFYGSRNIWPPKKV